MGASSWKYVIPYQQDIDAALKQLRRDVFERTDVADFGTIGQLRAMYKALSTARPEMEAVLQERLKALPNRLGPTKPPTIEALVDLCAEGGTHTILDIDHVSDEPEFGALFPVSKEALVDQFGTMEPTRDMFGPETTQFPYFEDQYDRWQGVYVILYKDGVPNEIYIEGSSGD